MKFRHLLSSALPWVGCLLLACVPVVAVRPDLLLPGGALFALFAGAFLWLSRGAGTPFRRACVLAALAAAFSFLSRFSGGQAFLLPCGIAATSVRMAAATAVFFCVFFFLPPRRARQALGLFALALFFSALAAAALAFLRRTGGWANPVYTDDHPSFMFRVAEFFGSFPHLENYVPHWNAGVVNSVLASSGTPAFALLGAPFFLPFAATPHLGYNAAFLFVFAVFIPLATYAAFRAAGFPRTVSAIGGTVCFSSSRFLLLWQLHFGTAGSALAMSCAPAAFLFLHAVTVRRSRSPWVWGGFLVSFALLLQWLPMGILAALLALGALSCARDWWSRRRFAALAACGGAAFLSALPLLRASAGAGDLMAYAWRAPAAPATFGALLAKVRPVLGGPVAGIHPLLAAMGLAGLPLLAGPRRKRALAIPFAGLVLVSLLGPFYRGNLQLERMLYPALGLLAAGVGFWLAELAPPPAPEAGRRRRAAWAAAWAAVAVCLVAGAESAARYHAGKTLQPFEGMPQDLQELVEEARARVWEGTRLLVAGKAGHEYGNGHIAYLPVLIGREMIACDYYGFPPGYVEMDCPPKRSRGQPGGMHGFMVRHGASHVLTCRRNYIDFFAAEPEHFQEVVRIPSERGLEYVLYEIPEAKGIVQTAGVEAKVESGFNRISVSFPGDVPEEAVLAYNWSDRFRAEPEGAEIAPEPLPTGETFLKVRPNGKREVRITYVPRF